MSMRERQDGSSMRRYNIVVLGAGGTGKSALSVRFKHGIFMDKYDPTIEDMYVKMVKVDGQKCVVQVIDTAGNEQFSMHHDLYLKNGEGFVLVYSVTARSTFNDLQGLRQRILKVKGTNDAPILLVGNKCDLEDRRMVFEEEGHNLAQRLSCPFLESSAKAKVNVDEIFHEIVRQVNLKTPESDAKTDKNCTMF